MVSVPAGPLSLPELLASFEGLGEFDEVDAEPPGAGEVSACPSDFCVSLEQL